MTTTAPMTDEELVELDGNLVGPADLYYTSTVAALRERLRIAEAKLADLLATEHMRDCTGETSVPYQEVVKKLATEKEKLQLAEQDRDARDLDAILWRASSKMAKEALAAERVQFTELNEWVKELGTLLETAEKDRDAWADTADHYWSALQKQEGELAAERARADKAEAK